MCNFLNASDYQECQSDGDSMGRELPESSPNRPVSGFRLRDEGCVFAVHGLYTIPSLRPEASVPRNVVSQPLDRTTDAER